MAFRCLLLGLLCLAWGCSGSPVTKDAGDPEAGQDALFVLGDVGSELGDDGGFQTPPPPGQSPDPGTDPNGWGQPKGCTNPPCPGVAER